MRIASSIIMLAMLGCGGGGFDPAPDTSIGEGDFRYQASTLQGEPLLTGWLRIDILPDSTIVGRWTTRWAPGADTTFEVGDQIGNGELRGRLTEDGGYVDLNPGYADNNVILLPTPTENGFRGTWYWSTIAGPRSGGRFTALRK